MDNKVVVIVAIALIAVVVIGGAVVLTGDDPDDTIPAPTPTPSDKDTVTYHANYAGGPTFSQNNISVPKCMFTYADHTFFKWNTKADGSGDMYTPESTEDAAKLQSNGVKDLYAYWGFTFSGEYQTSLIGDMPQVFIINQKPTVIDVLEFKNVSVPMETGNSVCWFGLSLPDSNWTYSEDFSTFIATTDKGATYKVIVSNITGASDLKFVDQNKGSIAVSFTYSGPVSMNFSISEITKKYTYHGNGGATAEGLTELSTNIIIGKQPFIREGYTFTVWAENADGTGQTFTMDKDGMLKFKESGLRDIYAQWTSVSA